MQRTYIDVSSHPNRKRDDYLQNGNSQIMWMKNIISYDISKNCQKD